MPGSHGNLSMLPLAYHPSDSIAGIREHSSHSFGVNHSTVRHCKAPHRHCRHKPDISLCSLIWLRHQRLSQVES